MARRDNAAFADDSRQVGLTKREYAAIEIFKSMAAGSKNIFGLAGTAVKMADELFDKLEE